MGMLESGKLIINGTQCSTYLHHEIFHFTHSLGLAKDVQANLPKYEYTYFASLTELSHLEAMVNIFYHLYRAVVILAIGAAGE